MSSLGINWESQYLPCFKPQVSLWKTVLCLIHPSTLCLGMGGSKSSSKFGLFVWMFGKWSQIWTSGKLRAPVRVCVLRCDEVKGGSAAVHWDPEATSVKPLKQVKSHFLNWTDTAVSRHTVLPSHHSEPRGCTQKDRSSPCLYLSSAWQRFGWVTCWGPCRSFAGLVAGTE